MAHYTPVNIVGELQAINLCLDQIATVTAHTAAVAEHTAAVTEHTAAVTAHTAAATQNNQIISRNLRVQGALNYVPLQKTVSTQCIDHILLHICI